MKNKSLNVASVIYIIIGLIITILTRKGIINSDVVFYYKMCFDIIAFTLLLYIRFKKDKTEFLECSKYVFLFSAIVVVSGLFSLMSCYSKQYTHLKLEVFNHIYECILYGIICILYKKK